MKFFKTKAVAALSITLLLSTQAKGMGADFGIDAEDVEISTPVNMALTKTEQFQQALKNGYDQISTSTGDLLKGAAENSKFAYDAVMANKSMSAGVGLGIIGAGALAYKKPQLAGKIATVAIPATMVGYIAKDNPELVKAGKEAVVNAAEVAYNAGKAAVNYAANSVIGSYIQENNLVVPTIIGGTALAAGAYKAYPAVKRGVARAANAVAPYAKKAAKVVVPVAAAAAVAKYSPETVEAVKDALVNAGTVLVDAGSVVANKVSEATPNFVKENTQMIIPTVAVGGFVAAKTAGPVKRAVVKTAQGAAKVAGQAAQGVANVAGKVNVGKTIAYVAPVAAVGLVAYDNQDRIKEIAQNVAEKVVANVTETAVPAVKVNFARIVNAARDYDYNKMAEFFTEHQAVVKGSAGVAGTVATGYGIYRKVKPAKRPVVQEVDAEDVVQNADNTIAIEGVTKRKFKSVRFAEQQEEVKSEAEAVANPLTTVVLPGQDAAPKLNVYEVPSRELSASVKEEVAKIIQPIEQRPVAQNVENIATMVSALETSQLQASAAAQTAKAYADLLEKANQVKEYFALTSSQLSVLDTDIANLKQAKGDLLRISKRIETIRRSAKGKVAAAKASN